MASGKYSRNRMSARFDNRVNRAREADAATGEARADAISFLCFHMRTSIRMQKTEPGMHISSGGTNMRMTVTQLLSNAAVHPTTGRIQYLSDWTT